MSKNNKSESDGGGNITNMHGDAAMVMMTIVMVITTILMLMLMVSVNGNEPDRNDGITMMVVRTTMVIPSW